MDSNQYFLNFQTKLVKSKPYRYFWQFWSNYAFVFFVVGALCFCLKDDLQELRLQVVTLVIVSFVIARGIMVTMINLIYKKLRPYQQYNFTPITSRFFSFQTKTPNSFPSRHTTAYFSVATVVLWFFPLMGSGLMLVSVLAGFARVVLGYHWPSDIAVGALLGLVIGCCTVLTGQVLFFT